MPFAAIEQLNLSNRLGQPVVLGISFKPGAKRDTLFVCAPRQQASSLFGKNAEQFMFQLMGKLPLDSERLDLIEVRGTEQAPEFWRWRFNWVGRSPLAPRSEPVTSSGGKAALLALLNGDTRIQVLEPKARRS